MEQWWSLHRIHVYYILGKDLTCSPQNIRIHFPSSLSSLKFPLKVSQPPFKMWLDLITRIRIYLCYMGTPRTWKSEAPETMLVWRRWYHGRKDTIMECYDAKDSMRLWDSQNHCLRWTSWYLTQVILTPLTKNGSINFIQFNKALCGSQNRQH